MARKLEGQTSDVSNKFLGSDFWQPGIAIRGVVLRKFESANGQCYALELNEPDSTNEVALGNLTGLRMAIQAAGATELEIGDKITLECTDLQPTGKGNPRIDSKYGSGKIELAQKTERRTYNGDGKSENGRAKKRKKSSQCR
jgi:hypothetical protein